MNIFQLPGVMVHCTEDKVVSGLHCNCSPTASDVLHVVQWVTAPLCHLVGYQPGVCDYDVCHGGIPLHEDRAEHDSSEHGRGS